MKLGIVLFNLGGPDSPEAVEPFLRNLFSDPAIISLPVILRKPLAWFIARRRAPFARAIYAHIGGRFTDPERDAGPGAGIGDGLGRAGVGGKGRGGDALLVILSATAPPKR